MLQALLHGKLTRAEEDMEDLLTSNTFGLMKYLPAESVLLPWLRRAQNPLLGSLPVAFTQGVVEVERWRFWPRLQQPGSQGCEPDVEIMLRHGDGERTVLLIEAKYRSGKSFFATDGDVRPNDQLAREYDNLAAFALEQGVGRAAVVYVTADWKCPRAEIEESDCEYKEKRGSTAAIYWLSWRTLSEILDAVSGRGADIASDMRDLLLTFELTTFRRLRYAGVRKLDWQFATPSLCWPWDLLASSLSHWKWRQT